MATNSSQVPRAIDTAAGTAKDWHQTPSLGLYVSKHLQFPIAWTMSGIQCLLSPVAQQHYCIFCTPNVARIFVRCCRPQ